MSTNLKQVDSLISTLPLVEIIETETFGKYVRVNRDVTTADITIESINVTRNNGAIISARVSVPNDATMERGTFDTRRFHVTVGTGGVTPRGPQYETRVARYITERLGNANVAYMLPEIQAVLLNNATNKLREVVSIFNERNAIERARHYVKNAGRVIAGEYVKDEKDAVQAALEKYNAAREALKQARDALHAKARDVIVGEVRNQIPSDVIDADELLAVEREVHLFEA
jgi:hypothetical protein